ncbi:UPF0348 protein [Bacillus amyloliquefaciens]|uniref:nucleotidyltransferase n=1 Tax=Bacillus amyloliquefaciens TaxID=1390 RepID=UPI00080C3C08|nr:nucleotidyltransferase [Bacillus amyloliquefaciens]OCB99420.1 UPF0348 protein [Bacillus amyloliquefaciens]
MKAVGIIVEYNPFHNGHAYHIQQARKQTESDIVIAVMSGNFLQRGEPAIVSKWSRTKMALQNGVDIVIELPYMFAVQKAEIFAQGAVTLLNHLRCSSLFFSSESGNINSFYETLSLHQREQRKIEEFFKKNIKTGSSYASAMSQTFSDLGIKNGVDLTYPNNILGFHYVKAINDLNLSLKPLTGLRVSQGYHEQSLPKNKESYASATSIRKTLIENQELNLIKDFVPSTVIEELLQYKNMYGIWHNYEDYFQYLKYAFFVSSSSDLNNIYEIGEGLENRILKVQNDSYSFEDYMRKLKTKRYTWTKLQRLNLHILTHTNRDVMYKLLEEGITYVRLLGMNTKGQSYLSKMKKTFKLPIVSKLSSFSNPSLDLDIKAGLVYSLPIREPMRSKFNIGEYSNSPIRFDEIKNSFFQNN